MMSVVTIAALPPTKLIVLATCVEVRWLTLCLARLEQQVPACSIGAQRPTLRSKQAQNLTNERNTNR